jgi:hypothetical protein
MANAIAVFTDRDGFPQLGATSMHVIERLLTASVSLLIGLSAAACGSNSTTTTSSSASAVSTPATAQAPKTATAQAPKTATTQAAQAAQWVTVVHASGHSDKRTDLFTLHGGRAKLAYSFTDDAGMGIIVGAIYVLKEGESLNKSGGVPEAIITKPGNDSTFLTKTAGRYYLEVSAAETHWTATISERR